VARTTSRPPSSKWRMFRALQTRPERPARPVADDTPGALGAPGGANRVRRNRAHHRDAAAARPMTAASGLARPSVFACSMQPGAPLEPGWRGPRPARHGLTRRDGTRGSTRSRSRSPATWTTRSAARGARRPSTCPQKGADAAMIARLDGNLAPLRGDRRGGTSAYRSSTCRAEGPREG